MRVCVVRAWVDVCTHGRGRWCTLYYWSKLHWKLMLVVRGQIDPNKSIQIMPKCDAYTRILLRAFCMRTLTDDEQHRAGQWETVSWEHGCK